MGLSRKNIRVGCHSLLQGIFPTPGSNPGLSDCTQILYCLSHHGSPEIEISRQGVSLGGAPQIHPWGREGSEEGLSGVSKMPATLLGALEGDKPFRALSDLLRRWLVIRLGLPWKEVWPLGEAVIKEEGWGLHSQELKGDLGSCHSVHHYLLCRCSFSW